MNNDFDGFDRLSCAIQSATDEMSMLARTLERMCDDEVASLTTGERKYYNALVLCGVPRLDAMDEARKLCRRYCR